ncbi:unnamed protein product [Sphagnum compactum]
MTGLKSVELLQVKGPGLATGNGGPHSSTKSFFRGSISFLPACLLPRVVYCSSAMARAALWSPRPGTNVSHFSGRLWCF